MVLQQGADTPVWGWADDGEKITVFLQGKTASTTARDGRWGVVFKNLEAGGPFEMTVSGNNALTIKNVLVGEVWICSGQSNMAWSVSRTQDAAATTASADDAKRGFSRRNAPRPTSHRMTLMASGRSLDRKAS